MSSETDKRPFGNNVLRLFALVGLTVSGFWLFKNLGVMALFGLPEADVVHWVVVAFPLLPFSFFLWAFRKTGTSKRNLVRPVLIALLVFFVLGGVAINVVELFREDSSLEEARKDGARPEEPIVKAGASGAPEEATLEVRVLASEQPTWPSAVTVSVALEESAKTHAEAENITERSIRAGGAPPYSVTLAYDPSQLKPQERYGVRARIEEGDLLLFESVYFTPAFGRTGLPGTSPSEPIDLVVQRVAKEVKSGPVSSGESKSDAAASPGEAEQVVPGLLDKRWKLRTLNGKTGLTRGDDRASFITLLQDGQEFRGNIGCVRLSGRYELEGDRLRFLTVATSRPVRIQKPGPAGSKAGSCKVDKKLERGFSSVLRHTQRYELSANRLTFFAEDGRALATFRQQM